MLARNKRSLRTEGANLPWIHPLLSATSSGFLGGSENLLECWNRTVFLMTQTLHHTQPKEQFYSGSLFK